jgi:predicted transcriptional regulator
MIKVTDIRGLREETGWPQWGLAKATGIRRDKISLIENGYVVPTAAELEKIEQALLAEIGRCSERLEQVMHSRVEVD